MEVNMKYRGNVWKFGDNIDTDAIIPARYLNTSDPKALAEQCMKDADPDFAKKMKVGDMIVAGVNFGCGSSREHAPIAIKTVGLSCVVARTFARIFFRNAFNMGLPIFESDELWAKVENGDEIEVDTDKGEIRILSRGGEAVTFRPVAPFLQQLVASGGLMADVKAKKARMKKSSRA